MLFLLFFSFFFYPIIQTRFNLYNTDPTLDLDHLQVNCLRYNDGNDRLSEKIEYCLGPMETNSFNEIDHLHINGIFTFEQLRQIHVNITELLSWSATIDFAEKYQDYLHHPHDSVLSKELFFICTHPWFGPQCQYSFHLTKHDSFSLLVDSILIERSKSQNPSLTSDLSCYTDMKCNRGGGGLCLDWREVCDGRIDCLDGGADEAQCFQLEMNECEKDEYRCHNGLCISKVFLDDIRPQCLDQSDLSEVFWINSRSLFKNEIVCQRGSAQFSCGDGQCVKDYDQCKSNRHLLLIDSISGQGDLSYSCWLMMMCLTKIVNEINQTSCDHLLTSLNINSSFQSCGNLIEFPVVPVLFGHIRFLYNVQMNVTLLPDYICYDQRLCDFLIPTYFFAGYSCRQTDQFDIDWTAKAKSWVSLIGVVNGYFRKCSTRFNIDQHRPNSSSLYCCRNSSKCISKHRILDNISDCYLNDDEQEFNLSCSLNDPLRFQCLGESGCYSSVVSKEICPPSYLRKFDQIEFRDICDRHTQMYPLIIDGQNHTDETDCDDWPCKNFYTRCDRFWSCSDGADEENCTRQMCPAHFLPCVSPSNYSFTCLPPMSLFF